MKVYFIRHSIPSYLKLENDDNYDEASTCGLNVEGMEKCVEFGNKLKELIPNLDEAFVITGIRLIQGDDKMFIAMPSRKVSEGVYDDIAHPVNQETRQMFEDAIFKAYDEMKASGEELVKIEL